MAIFHNSSRLASLGRGWITVMAFVFLSGCGLPGPFEMTPARPLPAMPVPIGPGSNADLSKLDNIVFTWERTEHADRYEFHIFNALNADVDRYMLRGLTNEATCHGNICGIKVRLVLPDSKGHAWRVRAINESGASAWTRRLFTWDKNGFLDATYLDES